MRVIIDTDSRALTVENGESAYTLDLYSREGFEEISRQWVRVGWNEKYPYTFTWLGRPIIQLPEDMIRTQEAIVSLKPDVIVETGVAHGGSLVYYAGLCRLLGRGRVIGVDIEIKAHNRRAIESHFLADAITLVEGSSTDPAVVDQVRRQVRPGESVLIFLDSNHSRQHVLAELEAYQLLVTPGSYIVATDGVMRDLSDVPRGRADWTSDNPCQAVKDFLSRNSNFEICPQAWSFNESQLRENVTHWPDGWLRRVR